MAAALESKEIWGDEADELDDEIMKMSSDDIRQRARMIDNDIRIMKSEMQRIRHESESQREKIKENHDKIKLNKQLPYLVANVVEVLEPTVISFALPSERVVSRPLPLFSAPISKIAVGLEFW